MKGTSISSTLDGRWVNTIVFRRPNRFASGTAASAERPESSVVPKKIPPSVARSTPNFRWNQ